MPTKTRSTLLHVDQQVTHQYAPPSWCHKDHTVYSEAISSNDTRWRGTSNCLHTKYTQGFPGGYAQWYDGTGTSTWSRITPGINWEAQGGEFPPGVLPTVNWNSLSTEAFLAMKPGMQGKFSGTNFLIELRDLKRMFDLWKRGEKFIRNLANANLNYHYGWKQTIRDLQDICKVGNSLDQRLEKLIANQGVPQKGHFRKVLCKEIAERVVNITGGQTRAKYTYVVVEPMVYTACMYYKYTMPDLTDFQRRMRGFLDAFGLTLTPKQVWNAIPLSFVVDWFWDVGKFLGQFDWRWIEPNVEILDFSSSILYDVKCVCTTIRNPGNVNNTTYYPSHEVSTRSYQRIRHIPTMGMVDINSGSEWTLTRFSLAASLLVQRCYGNKR